MSMATIKLFCQCGVNETKHPIFSSHPHETAANLDRFHGIFCSSSSLKQAKFYLVSAFFFLFKKKKKKNQKTNSHQTKNPTNNRE